MSDLNNVNVSGRLTRDPELSSLQSGLQMCKASIAVSSKYKDKEKVCFLDFTIFGKQADTFNQYTGKGLRVILSGELQLEQWKDADGYIHSKHTLLVNRFTFIDFKEREEQSETEQTPAVPQGDSIPF